jgi:predicted peptidase
MRSLSVSVFVLFIAMLTGCSARHVDWANEGAPAGTGFQLKQLTVDSDTYNYTVFVPHSYKPGAGQRYPVIVFLHGVLESGSDGKKNVHVGIGPAVSERAATFPFFVVFPQSHSDWKGDDKAKLCLTALDTVLRDYPGADPDRVVLTGLSNGGDGTWTIGARYTNRFAALVPMCSAADHDDAPKLTKIPIWCFHNSVDPFRSSGNTASMCEKINAAGGKATYTKYGDFGHDCWTRAYKEGEVFTWMAAQRRNGTTASAVP